MSNNAQKKYVKTDKGKATAKRAIKKYSQTENGKASKKKAAKKWYEKNKDKSIQSNKEWKEKHPDYYREKSLLRKYNITLDTYNQMLTKQDNKCAICQDVLNKPHVDHDHNTSKVRGLLCVKCNTALGKFNDDVNIIQRAIDYLKKHSDPLNTAHIDQCFGNEQILK